MLCGRTFCAVTSMLSEMHSLLSIISSRRETQQTNMSDSESERGRGTEESWEDLAAHPA